MSKKQKETKHKEIEQNKTLMLTLMMSLVWSQYEENLLCTY